MIPRGGIEEKLFAIQTVIMVLYKLDVVGRSDFSHLSNVEAIWAHYMTRKEN